MWTQKLENIGALTKNIKGDIRYLTWAFIKIKDT